MKAKFLFFLFALLLPLNLFAQGVYQKPPKDIMDVLDSPATPFTSISPARDKMALLEPLRYPPIADLAQPMLRLAGIRINPITNAPHLQGYSVKLTLKNISDGKETIVTLPAGARIVSPQWSADGKYLAAGNITPGGVELWIIEAASGKARKINGVQVNTAFGQFGWMPDQKNLFVSMVPKNRGVAPAYQNVTPAGPAIQETSGRRGAVQTFQDMLKNPNDEKLFEYYSTSQLAVVSLDGKIKEIGQPGIFDTASVSPDGQNILTSRLQKPFSYLYPAFRFPKEVEVWDMNGRVLYKVASLPLQDQIPAQGVATGPRGYGWVPTEAATLVWVEALDGGDPRSKVTPKDKLMKLAGPFTSAPAEMLKIEQRYAGRAFGEKGNMMFFYDFDRDKQRSRVFMTDPKNTANVKMLSDLNVNDAYNDIGNPINRQLPNGFNAVRQNGDEIFMTGVGSSPQGNRPFFRRWNLQTNQTSEIFRAGTEEYETFVAMTDDQGMNFITRKESISEPPNLFMRQVCPAGQVCTAMAYRPLTDFKDPAPQLRGIKKQLVTYKRADGVDLSFTLYLPPGYKEGTRLPALVWAYPLEFNDASTAGQVTGATNRFTQIGGISHLFLLLQGYAILDNTTMPIVGDPETVNDTFVQQVVDSAKAAIDKGVEMGVIDRDRVAVGGHSYGAFMTANLLAHSDLFRAGIARSGAYNRTLTPFGFQSERRSFWEAKDLYEKVSPFFYADKINEPMLMIHGEADNNQGTFPIQSERLFAAISGLGGKARLVMLPFEAHGYSARESTEHVLYEMVNWMDKYVKDAPKR